MLHDGNLKFQNATPQPYFKDNEKKILPKTYMAILFENEIPKIQIWQRSGR